MPNSEPHIIFCGALPPPVYGMAVINGIVFNMLGKKVALTVDFHRSVFGEKVPSSLNKLAAVALGVLRILFLRLPKERQFYSSVDDGWGGLYIIALACAARLRGCKITLHHHSYKYIDRRSRLMAALVYCAGNQARHVFLCGCMETDFRAVYSGPYKGLICTNPIVENNAIKTQATPTNQQRQARPLTLGFLSNITFEKGIGLFLDLLVTCAEEGLEIEAIVAGPVMSSEVQSALDTAQKRLGNRLSVIGPVYGPEKEKFFADIDCFVFPTIYPSESFGLVLIEALFAERPFIAYGRGCIKSFADFKAAYVIDKAAPFVEAALPIVREMFARPDHLAALKTQARAQGQVIQDKSLKELKVLTKALEGP